MSKMNPKAAGEELKVPTDLRKALVAAPMAKAQWSDLTPIERRDLLVGWTQPKNRSHIEPDRESLRAACSPNNPKLGSQGLKNGCSKFSMERD